MISWNEITAECGDYREGFVAVFRKYEGQETDERSHNDTRIVTVTAASFARHMGIHPDTFRAWVAKSGGAGALTETLRAEKDARRLRAEIRRAAPEAIAAAITDLDVGTQAQIRVAIAPSHTGAHSAPREREPREISIMDGLGFLSESQQRLEWALEVFAKKGRLVEDVKDAIGGFIDTFEMRVEELRALKDGGISDAALRELIERSA